MLGLRTDGAWPLAEDVEGTDEEEEEDEVVTCLTRWIEPLLRRDLVRATGFFV